MLIDTSAAVASSASADCWFLATTSRCVRRAPGTSPSFRPVAQTCAAFQTSSARLGLRRYASQSDFDNAARWSSGTPGREGETLASKLRARLASALAR